MRCTRLVFLLLVLFNLAPAFAQNAGSVLVCNTGGISYATSGPNYLGSHLYPTSCYYYFTNFGYNGNGTNGGHGGTNGNPPAPQATNVTVNAPTECQFNSLGGISNTAEIQVIGETLGRQTLGRDFVPGDRVTLILDGNPSIISRFRFRSYAAGRLLMVSANCGAILEAGLGGGGQIP